MFHPDPNHKPYVHPNYPVFTPDGVDAKGWRIPSIGEPIRTYWMAYVLQPKPQWRISAYWTHQKVLHEGYTHYREPASVRAWMTVLKPLTIKWFKGIWDGTAFAPKKGTKKS